MSKINSVTQLSRNDVVGLFGGASITYGALTSGSTPAGGAPKSAPAGTYVRGCSAITRCARG